MSADDESVESAIEFEEEVCVNCGLHFQVPDDYQELRKYDGRNFYCPNGHAQHYNYAEREKQKNALTEANAKINELSEELNASKIEIRQLKCRLMGKNTMFDRIRTWWKGT